MPTIRLPNPARALLRKRIAEAALASGMDVETVKQLKAELNIAARPRLLELANHYQLDVLAIIIEAGCAVQSLPDNSTVNADDDATDTAAPSEPEPTEPAPVIDPIADLVKADIATLNDLWREMDVAGFRAKITELATAAHKPAVTIEVEVPTGPNIPRQLARPNGTKTAQQVFGVAGKLASLPLTTYDAKDTPAIDPYYVLPASMPAIVSQVFRHNRPVWLTGPAGTGKTTLAMQIAGLLGRPFTRISCTATTEASTLVGMTVPAQGGGTVWQDGQLAAAIRRPGCVILIDEPSVARDGALYVFQAVLDSARAIYCDETGEVIRCAPDVIFLLADNTAGNGDASGQYAGTRQVSRALLDRAGAMVAIDYLPQSVETGLLHKKTGAPLALCKALVAFAHITRQQTAAGDLPAAIGLRRLMSWAEMICDGIRPSEAAHLAFVNSAAPDAQEQLRQLLSTHASDAILTAAI